MASAGLGYQGKNSKFARHDRSCKTSLRDKPEDDDPSLPSSILPGEVVEVLAEDSSKSWVQVKLALTEAIGWVRKQHLAPCPEGTRVHDRLTAVPSEVKKVEVKETESRFKEVVEKIERSNKKGGKVTVKRVWFITGHYLGETGMVTGNKEVLFHGTSDEASEAIVTGGFDDQFSCGGNFGSGLYFAPDPSKSLQYNENHLLLCEVALGLEQNRIKYHEQTDGSLDYEEVFSKKRKRSVQATWCGHEERIVYHPTQCKPVYLVELEEE